MEPPLALNINCSGRDMAWSADQKPLADHKLALNNTFRSLFNRPKIRIMKESRIMASRPFSIKRVLAYIENIRV